MNAESVNQSIESFDVVVVGAGPAGLSAALVLGRACRKVLICDGGPGRNAPAEGVHGFFTQDGTPPSELRRLGREQLQPYDVTYREVLVETAQATDAGFLVSLRSGSQVVCRKLIVATGIVDELPKLNGLDEIWGSTAILCPYCHGWEFRGKRWAFMATPEFLIESATLLRGWTDQLTYVTNGNDSIADSDRRWLTERSIAIREEPIAQLVSSNGQLKSIEFETGPAVDCSILQFRAPFHQRSSLAKDLGCTIIAEGPMAGMVKTEPTGATEVPGLFIVGDAAAGLPSVATAAAEGAFAAAVANRFMLAEEAAQVRPA
ncbi:NAD(P)/FAD-dependent oxidoreductase [Bremerella cremea]|uniref:NAD(P)/FAD-dependent oxidoreductase n=1 Tax=Bremerella cremea TaxID=1031537 RepID=UPI0031EA7C34